VVGNTTMLPPTEIPIILIPRFLVKIRITKAKEEEVAVEAITKPKMVTTTILELSRTSLIIKATNATMISIREVDKQEIITSTREALTNQEKISIRRRLIKTNSVLNSTEAN
jgi:hypothetical protein